jgi:CelD/BcsL family acetyltransferase involved in cellulose biosynthesis
VTGPALEAEIVDDIELLREEWQSLALASRNVFATWEWNTLWWRYFGARSRAFVSACREADGTLAAIVPLYLWRERPVRVFRFFGHGLGDQLGPICAEGERGLATRALESALEAVAGWDVVVGEQLPAVEGWAERADARVLSSDGTPLIKAVDWDEYLSTRSAKARQEIRSDGRRLERRHELVYRRVDDDAELESGLDTLFALHERRFGSATSFGGAPERFHREFAAGALERGWLRLWLLELDGSVVAARYGFRFGGVECGYQAGWDPRWRSASVGFVLQVHVIRAAFEDGIREYRLLRGGEAYKYRLATDDPGLVTVAFANGPLGRLAVNSVAFSRPAIRRLRSFPAALRSMRSR